VRSSILFSLIGLTSLLIGCGYHWEAEYPNGVRPSVSVPFIPNDADGTLTTAVIYALSASGLVDVVAAGGDYQLSIAIVSEDAEKIGFRVDPQKVDGKVRKNLLAVEGRKKLLVEASLCRGGSVAFGPYKIEVDAEYDYVDGDSAQDLTFVNPSGTLVTVLPFSLGQLESIDAAEEAARKPLYQRLGQKIVDAILSEW
jgi:hypothetical protein